ncbi:restriction endonuclease subunit S [Trichocoleus sp. FACHB-591]|uniref:restriction endonuclease subunit S n=1 Tax=Trichocoleus sp. FACHB-591 TaxID=2692872 RepID=UPI001688B708|nr:restriction endonuclease subunit S [Trichocoleus sp. FACHB-591]MBD2097671.1 restriction endonuclease subunit S [Trichocoleus sp. FACHB-591]
MSDELTELPEGWEWAQLSDVLSILSGEAFKKKDYSSSGVKLLQIANVSFGKVVWEQQNFLPKSFLADYPELVLEKNDIVMALNRPILNDLLKIARLSEEDAPAILYQRVARFNLFIDEMRDYFFCYTGSPKFLQLIRTNLQGSDQPYINTSTLPNFPISIPPLNEQKRIVTKIEELRDRHQRAKQALEAIPELCDRFRQSVLAAAFRGDLTADWREENPDVEPASVLLEKTRRDRRQKWEEVESKKLQLGGKSSKDDKWKAKYQEPEACNGALLPKLPETWTWAPVELLATKVVDGVHKKPNYIEQGIPFVTVKNLTAGSGISFENLNYISEEDHKEFFKRANPEKGDLLISKDGTLGVTRVIRADTIFSIFVSVALVKPVSYEMSDYLELAFVSPQMQNQMLGTGSGLQHIHLKDLRRYAVPVTSLEEQAEILLRVRNLFNAIDKIEQQYTGANKHITCLNQAILAKAFRGELVEQDPNDEPASVLLEHIRAEREKADNGKKTKGKRAKQLKLEV